MDFIKKHKSRIKRIIVGLIAAIVILHFGGKAYIIISMSESTRYPVPVEIVEIEESIPENPYDYGDCIADLPWNVEIIDPDITLRMNKEKHITFNYSSYMIEESLYDSMVEYDNYKAFFEQNNIYSDEDLTCYLYSYNSKDISMKYLFKPTKQLEKAIFISTLQIACPDHVEKVYDVRNDNLRALVKAWDSSFGTSYMITIISPINKKTISFSVLDSQNNLTEEDIFNFISTISLKEQ